MTLGLRLGLRGRAAVKAVYALDRLTSALSVAYSVRRLRTAYAGPLLRIRRSSDQAQTDIGFDANGNLNLTALLAFVGASDGYVVMWYDQSGNGLNLSQSNAVNQPRLVSGGAVYRENGRPFLRFFGGELASFNRLELPAPMTNVGSVVAVNRMAVGGDGFFLGHPFLYYWHSGPQTNLLTGSYASGSVKNGAGFANGVAMSPLAIPWPTSLILAQVDPQTPAAGVDWQYLGDDRGGTHATTLGGGYAEVVVTATALTSSERQAVSRNQGTYFSIGVA